MSMTFFIKNKGERMEKDIIIGKIRTNKKGFAFFIPEDENYPDVFISKFDINDALDNDIVEVEIIKEKTEDASPEGRVVKVIERNEATLIGKFQSVKNYGFVVLEDKNASHDIFIPKEGMKKAKTNDLVVVKIDKFDKSDKNPTGHVVEVLGNINQPGVDILSIVKKYDLPVEFSKKTRAYAKSLDDKLRPADYKNRKDLRNLLTVTIDGYDSKDFDDAISIEKNGDFYDLYVHIADVSHYVGENSPIDRDAYQRGNSVYLMDRVIPMLPEKLSNGICSLNPQEDRLAVTVKMTINKNGKVKDYSFYESVIKSDHRLIYDDVSDFLEDKANIFHDKKLEEALLMMYDLSKKIEKRRQDRGSIDFKFNEARIELDKKGKVKDISIEERRVSNQIIENFMIITNEVVGGHFANMDVAFLYRVHEKPDEEKVTEFKRMIGRFGLVIKGQDLYPKDFQQLLKEVEGKKEEVLINNVMLRTMKKAEYRRNADIHFGLASMNYSHFTAPIRRYSDLVVHRILKDSLKGKIRKEKDSYLKKLDEIAERVSTRERVAEEAEREVVDLKKCEYMLDYIGDSFDGVITSVTGFGFFVELANTVEGLVHMRNLRDDYYIFDEENYHIIGEHTGRKFELGQPVRIKVDNVTMESREIDFKLVEKDDKK